MSNFESKHPRAKDGKFTEKRRKEAGMTLELENQLFTPPSTPRLYKRGKIVAGKEISTEDPGHGAIFVYYECPERGVIAPGVWHVSMVRLNDNGDKDIIYSCSEGDIGECYRPNGSLKYRYDKRADESNKGSMIWDKDGILREVDRFYRKDEILEEVNKNGEYLESARYDEIGKPIEKTVIIGRGLDADGNVKLARIEYSYDEEDEDGNEMHTSKVTEL